MLLPERTVLEGCSTALFSLSSVVVVRSEVVGPSVGSEAIGGLLIIVVGYVLGVVVGVFAFGIGDMVGGYVGRMGNFG